MQIKPGDKFRVKKTGETHTAANVFEDGVSWIVSKKVDEFLSFDEIEKIES
jgi:hypothetical protein